MSYTNTYELLYTLDTVELEIFEDDNIRVFCGSAANRENFTVEFFNFSGQGK